MSEIIQNFVSALNEELLSQRKRSTEESYNLQDGERTTSTSDKTIYTFFIDEDLKATRLKVDTPVTLIVNDEETYATLVSIGDKKIVVSTDKDFGKRLPIAQIKFDSSYLIEKLKKCYEEKIEGKNSPINIDTIEKLKQRNNVLKTKMENLNIINKMYNELAYAIDRDLVTRYWINCRG